MNLKPYLIACIILGVTSAIADSSLKSPNPIPYISAGTGVFGGLCYILLLIVGKWVE